jgi:hypothetical protein
MNHWFIDIFEWIFYELVHLEIVCGYFQFNTYVKDFSRTKEVTLVYVVKIESCSFEKVFLKRQFISRNFQNDTISEDFFNIDYKFSFFFFNNHIIKTRRIRMYNESSWDPIECIFISLKPNQDLLKHFVFLPIPPKINHKINPGKYLLAKVERKASSYTHSIFMRDVYIYLIFRWNFDLIKREQQHAKVSVRAYYPRP